MSWSFETDSDFQEQLNWIEVFSTTTLTFAGLVITGYFSESKDKKIMRRTFERYVSDTVLERIFENPDVVDFEGRDITATVMATDIQGWTFAQLSEQWNVSINTLLSRKSRAMQKIQRQVRAMVQPKEISNE